MLIARLPEITGERNPRLLGTYIAQNRHIFGSGAMATQQGRGHG